MTFTASRCRQGHLEANALNGARGVGLHVYLMLISVLEQAHQGTQAPALKHLG